MLQLDNGLVDLSALIENPCSNPNIRNSKLSRVGRGRLPENTADARSAPLNPQRLARLSAELGTSAKHRETESEALSRSSLKLASAGGCHQQNSAELFENRVSLRTQK